MDNQPIQADQYRQDPLFNLEELTVNNMSSIDELKLKIKRAQEMIKDAYTQDSTFVHQEGLVREEKKNLSQLKEGMNKQSPLNSLLAEVKDLKETLKEKEDAVSEYGKEYLRQSGKNGFERDGAEYLIVTSAKVVKKLR